MLRRRTSLILGWIFAVAMIASFVGVAMVVWRDPAMAAQIFLAATLAGIGLARAGGTLQWSTTLRTGAIIAVPLAAFGMGAYALWAYGGVPRWGVIGLLAAAVGLVLVMLVRALIFVR
jgi:hypothetical protein